MTDDPRRWLATKLHDIANIEVNTVQSEISARQPPPWQKALREIAGNYVGYLKKNGTTASSSELEEVTDRTRLVELFARLKEISEAEKNELDQNREAADDAKRIIFFRIKEACARILQIMSEQGVDPDDVNSASKPVSIDARIQIRKMWELGTSRVLMQTTLALDGDIVNRIASGNFERDDLIVRLHNTSLEQSITYWQMVLTVISQLARGSLGRLFGKS